MEQEFTDYVAVDTGVFPRTAILDTLENLVPRGIVHWNLEQHNEDHVDYMIELTSKDKDALSKAVESLNSAFLHQ